MLYRSPFIFANTRTADVAATVAQIRALEKVGADIVRVSVPTMDDAEAFRLIKQQVSVPLVAVGIGYILIAGMFAAAGVGRGVHRGVLSGRIGGPASRPGRRSFRAVARGSGDP